MKKWLTTPIEKTYPMKYVDEYRNSRHVQSLAQAIQQTVTRPWNIMEICGGQTHAIARYRLESFLPPEIKLLHGPGCPVCVTPVEIIDKALQIAAMPQIIFTSFGDMMRVPGSNNDLLSIKARTGDIRMVYSPLDAVRIAEENPRKEIVFFAIGFETTAPVNLMALHEAMRRKLTNFTLLTSLFQVPPAIEAILSGNDTRINAFLTAGHVCTITGNAPYRRLAEQFKTPMVVTGFEPSDILYGIYKAILQLESGQHTLENAYKRAVPEEGNTAARHLMNEYLEPCNQAWRGIGVIPHSGLRLKADYALYDAAKKYPIPVQPTPSLHQCKAGEIMRGLMQPGDCPYFGTACTPSAPIGAPMVSAEGVCAAYYRYN